MTTANDGTYRMGLRFRYAVDTSGGTRINADRFAAIIDEPDFGIKLRRHYRIKRDSKGWRKHIRKMKAKARR